MSTLDHPGGRYGAHADRLADAVLDSAGHTTSALRRAVFVRASRPHPPANEELPAALATYVDKVAHHAFKVTDRDVAELLRAGHSDDAVFELTVAAALGAALGRLDRGLAALRSTPTPE